MGFDLRGDEKPQEISCSDEFPKGLSLQRGEDPRLLFSRLFRVHQFSSLPVFQSRRHPQLPAAPPYHDFPACHQTPEPKERDRHLKQARLIQLEVTCELCSPCSSTKLFHSRQQTRGCCEPKGKSSCQPSPSQEHLSLHPRRLTPAGRRKKQGLQKKTTQTLLQPHGAKPDQVSEAYPGEGVSDGNSQPCQERKQVVVT